MDYSELFHLFSFFQQFKQLDDGYLCLFYFEKFHKEN